MMALGTLSPEIPAAWAVLPLHSGQLAHYFIRGDGNTGAVRSKCGLVNGYETRAVALLNPGTFRHCRHCEKRL